MQLTRIKLGLLQIKERRLILCIQFHKKNFAHKVKDLKFKKIKGKKVMFQIYDETNEATRFIYLKLQNGKWKVVNEGY